MKLARDGDRYRNADGYSRVAPGLCSRFDWLTNSRIAGEDLRLI